MMFLRLSPWPVLAGSILQAYLTPVTFSNAECQYLTVNVLQYAPKRLKTQFKSLTGFQQV